jgi:hypothetical protein
MRRLLALLALALTVAAACTARSPDEAGSSPTASASGPSTSDPPSSLEGSDGLRGDRLVVLRDDGNLVTMDPDGGSLLALTTDAGIGLSVQQPVASPNGRSLAWVEIRAGRASVVTASRFGTNRVEIPLSIAPFFLEWDPTSSRIVYLGNAGTSIGLGVIEGAVAAPQDSPIGGGSPLYLAWSPSGKELFVHVGADGLGRTDLAHELQPAEDDPGTFQAPVWLPDDRVVYAARSGSSQQLVIVGDGERRVLETFQGGVLFVSSPDGQRLAYRLDRPDGTQVGVFVRDVDGGPATLITRAETTAFFWSPGSDALLLMTVEPGAEIEATHRWRVWDGRQRFVSKPFLPSPTYFSNYVPFFDQYAQAMTPWSPDNTAFAYAGLVEGRAGIWVQSVRSGAAPSFASGGEFVAWSPPE